MIMQIDRNNSTSVSESSDSFEQIILKSGKNFLGEIPLVGIGLS